MKHDDNPGAPHADSIQYERCTNCGSLRLILLDERDNVIATAEMQDEDWLAFFTQALERELRN